MKRILSVLIAVGFAALSVPAQEAVSPQPGAAPARTPGGLLGRRPLRPGFASGSAARPGFGAAARPGFGGMRPGLGTGATGAVPAGGVTPGGTGTAEVADEEQQKEGAPALNFNGATLDMVFDIYQGLVKKTIIRDPQLPNATITLISRRGQQLSDEEQIKAIEAVLEMNGVHLENYDENFIRAIPRKDARTEGIPLIMDMERKLGESVRVVSMMIQFKNIAIDEAQKALEGFKSKMGILLVFERTNSILVTDTEMNVNRMLEIAKAIDVSSPVLESVFVRQIKNALATDIQQHLQKIVEESMKEQEKNGKAANQAAAARQAAIQPPRLLGGRPNPAANLPVNNPSLVMNVSDADRGMIRGKVLILADERSNKLIVVTMKPNMDFFDKVIEQLDVETTPDTVVKVYRLKYAEAEEVSDMINDLIGNAPNSKTTKGAQNPAAARGGRGGNLTARTPQPVQRASANQRTGDSKAGELSKENTTVLADKRINGLVVMTDKELVPTIESIIESMDVKLSQVLIETVIIEVSLGDDFQTGVDWLQRGRKHVFRQEQVKNGFGQPLYYKLDDDGNATRSSTTTDTGFPIMKTIKELVRDGNASFFNNNNYMLGGGSGLNGGLLNGLVGTSTTTTDEEGNPIAEAAAAVTPIVGGGGGVNYILKSDKLNLGAIISASKNDNRAKYIASPVVMTVDNKEAQIDATASRQFLTGWSAQSSGSWQGSGMPTPNYSSKDIGIKVKVKPKINPNGTVMLNVEEEYNQVSEKQSILTPNGSSYVNTSIEVPSTRKMTSDVLLENRQTVVFGGLLESHRIESEGGIPILKDIPWIGKWLFGYVEHSETRTELLVFMTPYVLDDAESAQLEAIRRKKTMPDARPWEDDGWSASELADPVSRKEQLRRIKEEFAKQDEERKTKLAIEKMKVERAKALRELSDEERKVWLNLHKDELQKEERERLEKQLQDAQSQAELQKLVDQIKKRRLGEAEKEIKAAEDLTKSMNERSRIDAEAAKKAAEAKKPAEASKPAAAPAKPAEAKKPEPPKEAAKAEGKK